MIELRELLAGHGGWAVGVALGFPLALLVLTELSLALDRAGSPLAPFVRRVRNWFLPLVAGLLLLRTVLGRPGDDLWVRLVETACWVMGVVLTIGFINTVVFETAETASWRSRVPRLLRDLVGVLLVAVAAALVYQFVWGRELQGALAALGVSSIVVGLALQEPLGNLFSGLVLLMERPFEVGDAIEVGKVAGRVREVNWRSAHIVSPEGVVQIVPNSALNKETINNYSRPISLRAAQRARPAPVRSDEIEVGFGYQDPPNKVREILLELARSTEGVLAEPQP
ncbi:MAG: mechanosensitive ion channel family protein, partial [Myxococcaceae bacterium]